MQTSSDSSRNDFFYDDKGNVFAMKYRNRDVFLPQKSFWGYSREFLTVTERNLSKYEYNSWGKLLNQTDYSSNGLGRRNPLHFKGYYYDEELGMYYLNSRYYDPETGRFVDAVVSCRECEQENLAQYNLYVYCVWIVVV